MSDPDAEVEPFDDGKYLRSAACPAIITEMSRKVVLDDPTRAFLRQKRADFELMGDTIEAALRLHDVDGEAIDLQEAWKGRKTAEREADDLRRQLQQLRLSIEAEAREATRAKVLESGAQAVSSGDD